MTWEAHPVAVGIPVIRYRERMRRGDIFLTKKNKYASTEVAGGHLGEKGGEKRTQILYGNLVALIVLARCGMKVRTQGGAK